MNTTLICQNCNAEFTASLPWVPWAQCGNCGGKLQEKKNGKTIDNNTTQNS